MDDLKLFDGEYKFACLVWDNEPLGSGELVKLSAEKAGLEKIHYVYGAEKIVSKRYPAQ